MSRVVSRNPNAATVVGGFRGMFRFEKVEGVGMVSEDLPEEEFSRFCSIPEYQPYAEPQPAPEEPAKSGEPEAQVKADRKKR